MSVLGCEYLAVHLNMYPEYDQNWGAAAEENFPTGLHFVENILCIIAVIRECFSALINNYAN